MRAVVIVLVLLAGCGWSSAGKRTTCPGEGCSCLGVSCTCVPGYYCQFHERDGASLSCASGASCGGECGAGCTLTFTGDRGAQLMMGDHATVTCSDAARDGHGGMTGGCEVTAGASSTLTCSASICTATLGDASAATCASGASCSLTCSGHCSLACDPTSACMLACPGDPAGTMHTVTGTSGC